MRRRTASALAVVGATLLVGVAPVAAAVADKKTKTPTITIKLTEAGCPARVTAPSGTVTFKVKHVSGDRVAEWEVLAGPNIIGEAEDIAVGSHSDFTLTLDPGSYNTKCPGGSRREDGKLVIT